MILVVGASGQVARALARQAPETVRTLGRPELDIADATALAYALDTQRPTVVINAAAYTAVDKAESEEGAAMAANAEGPTALARLCAERQTPLIHISTDYVFSGKKAGPYVETDVTGPLGVYGRSKLAGEQGVLAAGAPAVIARTAWVYGAQGQNFVRTMLRLSRTRPTISVVNDQRGCPTYADDLAAALLAIADKLPNASPEQLGIFHIAGSGACTWREFAEGIFAGAAQRGGPSAKVEPITTAQYPTPAPRPANSQLDGAKLEAAYGLKLPHWRDSLDACLDRIAAEGWPE